MQDKVAGLQWEIKKVLIVEEELKSCGEELATSYTYFMVYVQHGLQELAKRSA